MLFLFHKNCRRYCQTLFSSGGLRLNYFGLSFRITIFIYETVSSDRLSTGVSMFYRRVDVRV